MPTDADLAVRVLLAALLGAGIGLERELTGQSAGLRTHITISLGAALFAIASAYSFTEFIQPRAETNYQVDVTRIASTIVTGVGFLGGGAIIKHGATVSGLTTAASIWVTAAVGLAIGLGNFFVATVTTLVLLLVLAGLRRPSRWLHQRAAVKQSVEIQLTSDADTGQIVNLLLALPGVSVKAVSVRDDDRGVRKIRASLKGTELHARLATLAERDDVTDIDVGV